MERVVEVEKEVEVERLVHVEKEVGVRNEEVEKLRRDLELQARAQFAQFWRNSAQFSDAAQTPHSRRSATATSCWTSSCSSASRRWR